MPPMSVPSVTPLIPSSSSSYRIKSAILIKNECVIELTFNDGLCARLHVYWLIDNCACCSCQHPDSGQRLKSIADLPPPHECVSRAVVDVLEFGEGIRIDWLLPCVIYSNNNITKSTSHVSTFSARWLREHNYDISEEEREGRHSMLKPIVWSMLSHSEQLKNISVNHEDLMATNNDGLLKSLHHLRDYGLVIIRDTPLEHSTVLDVAKRFGNVRDTFYGLSWDVRSVPNAENIAYTSIELRFHMDLCYFESPPGLQLLHCLKNDVDSGGESLFIDGLKVVEILRAEDPNAFDILTRVPVTYHYKNGDNHRYFQRPIIDFQPHCNDQYGIYFSPQFQGPMDVPSDMVGPFYDAYRKFVAITRRKEHHLKMLSHPGDLMIFNNRRVFHARSGFNSNSGHRHLRGCYVDLDDFFSKLRVLDPKSQQ